MAANQRTATLFSTYLTRGQMDKALEVAYGYTTVLAANVKTSGAKVKLLGTVLHISKAKKLAFTRTVGEKKQRRETSYFRLVFCREHTECTTDVFAVLFESEDRDRFLQSPSLHVGRGILIIKPQLEGAWRGLRMIRTKEPCLPTASYWTEFLPDPFPQTGFVSFALHNVDVSVTGIAVTPTCSGRTCGGLYGVTGCPCVTSSQLPRHAFTVSVLFGNRQHGGDFTNCCEQFGLQFEPFTSVRFTDLFVEPDILEVAFQACNETLTDLFEFVEAQIEANRWSAILWSKSVTTSMDDNTPSLMTPKCHIVDMRRTAGNQTRFREVSLQFADVTVQDGDVEDLDDSNPTSPRDDLPPGTSSDFTAAKTDQSRQARRSNPTGRGLDLGAATSSAFAAPDNARARHSHRSDSTATGLDLDAGTSSNSAAPDNARARHSRRSDASSQRLDIRPGTSSDDAAADTVNDSVTGDCFLQKPSVPQIAGQQS